MSQKKLVAVESLSRRSRILDSRLRGNDREGVRLRRTGVWGVPRFCTGVIARSEATKQSQGGGMRPDEHVDCRAFSLPGSENGSQ